MDQPPPNDITILLNRIASGDRTAEETLFPAIYAELKRMAARYLQRERPGHTLQATALVHEAYLKLVPGSHLAWQNRNHFFAVAARVMRNILVDHARKRCAGKRAGVSIDPLLEYALAVDDSRSEMIVSLNEALNRLESLDQRQARIVEMRFFGGMTEAEIGEFLGVSSRTVKRDWAVAKAWLYGELGR